MDDAGRKAEEYISRIPMWAEKKNSLADVREFLHRMGDPDTRMKIIHVAGTNGKGSVCAYTTAILREAGYHVGTFVSPHLTDVRERFLLDGQMAEQAEFLSAFEMVLALTKEMMAEGYCHPTYFEFLFLMAMGLFDRISPDYVILETGLGGSLDITNVITHPLVSVITSISLDHVQYLGDTVEKIAKEKAGIIKPGVPVVYDDTQPEASRVIAGHAGELCAPAYPVAGETAYGLKTAAPYQRRNAALAVKALEVSGIAGLTEPVIREGLKKTVWEGRMEEIAPDIWMDGAHNVGGTAAFAEAVQSLQRMKEKNVRILFAAVSDKDYSHMLDILADRLHPEKVYVVQMNGGRAVSLETLLELCRKRFLCPVAGYEDEKEALETAMEEKPEDARLFIVGSLHLIGDMKKILRRRQDAGF